MGLYIPTGYSFKLFKDGNYTDVIQTEIKFTHKQLHKQNLHKNQVVQDTMRVPSVKALLDLNQSH